MYAKEKIKELIMQRGEISFEQLKKELKISKHEKREFRKLIRDMSNENIITIDSSGLIRIDHSKKLKGIYRETKYDYGFVLTEDGVEYFIPAKYTNGAMEGDEVLITTVDRGPDRTVGKVSKLINRKDKYITVDLKNKGKRIKTSPEKDFKYFIQVDLPRNRKPLKDGKYRVQLKRFDEKKQKFYGELGTFIGTKDDKYIDLYTLVSDRDIPFRFDNEIIKEAEEVSSEKIVKGNRVDYRDIFTVTIDGDDAKDFDDAISVIKEGDKFLLYVHIADVSHYVKEGSAIDKEAIEREFSVYLPGLTIPMLPKALSNGVCSLNPKVDRYSLSVLMEFDKNSEPKLISIDKSIINSNFRLTYNEVNKLFMDREFKNYDDELKDFLFTAEEAYKILKNQSKKRGTIEFLSEEPKFILDENNKIIDIEKKQQLEAEELIEEFMIATNRVIATKFESLGVPFLYRVHEKPSPEKLLTMKELLKPYGVRFDDEPKASDIQAILERLSENPSFEKINDIVLRSMMKARYSDENLGHYALALKYYSHFTSPIRRYPDLLIHRIISDQIAGKLSEKKKRHYSRIVEEIGERASEIEKILVELERDADSLKKAEFMSGKINQEFEGKVSGVTEFGLFVRLDNTCEGLVAGDDFMSNYVYNEKDLTAITKHNNKKYEVGTPVRVRVVNVNIFKMQIDFEIIERDGKFGRKENTSK